MDAQSMGINEWLLIAGTVVGPLVAVQTQKWIERSREINRRKAQIFESLMATRGAKLSPEHVRALNSIDFAFYQTGFGNKKDQSVLEAWNEYRDALNENLHQMNEASISGWVARREELFVNLLVQMSIACKFPFPKDQLRFGNYSPVGHAKVDQQGEQYRAQLLEVLGGERSISIKLDIPKVGPEVSPLDSIIKAALPGGPK